ncbi:MAG: hypothetical protein ACOCQW_04210 [Halanaerobiaceae bacterium]
MKVLQKENSNYTILDNLFYVKIRTNEPDEILSNIKSIIKILTDNNIAFIETGLSLNRIYIILKDNQINNFVKLFRKAE